MAANIFSQYLQPVRSITDRMADLDAQDFRREQLAGARQQNQLQALAMQRDAELRGQQQQDNTMLQQLAGQHGSDQNALIRALRGSGRMALMSQADAIEKALLERQKTEAVIGKDREETKSKQIENQRKSLTYALQGLQTIDTPEEAEQYIAKGVQDGVWDMGRATGMIKAMRSSPGGFNQWRIKSLMQILDPKESLPRFEKVEAGNRIIMGSVAPGTAQFTPQQEVKKAPEGFNIGPDGGLSIDPGFLNAKKQIAAAGKTNVSLSVNTEKSLLNEMAKGLGTQLDAGLATANTASTTINNARELRKLVGDGKIITGPLADKRVLALRVGETLGVTGKDTAEKLANTATAVQNLAKAELQAAESMKGQGQITEAERAIIRRAAAGTIDMSGPELVALSNALEKTARGRIKSHQANVERLRALPGAAPLVPFYQAPEVPAEAPQQGAGAAPDLSDFKIIGVK